MVDFSFGLYFWLQLILGMILMTTTKHSVFDKALFWPALEAERMYRRGARVCCVSWLQLLRTAGSFEPPHRPSPPP